MQRRYFDWNASLTGVDPSNLLLSENLRSGSAVRVVVAVGRLRDEQSSTVQDWAWGREGRTSGADCGSCDNG
jgi:hypothetical protein